VFARLNFAVAFSDLLFDFFGDLVNGCVKVAFHVFGEKVRAAHAQAHGATELFFRNARMVVFERDARVNGALVKMVELFQTAENMVFYGFGERYVVRRKYQFHVKKMQFPDLKIQFFLYFGVVGSFEKSIVLQGDFDIVSA
jgi:hypothetical protein